MSMSSDTPRENLTLTESDLAACRPIVGEGGHVLRALCPFHGSDRQRSLRVQVHSGRFVCFACGAWGYMESRTGAVARGAAAPGGLPEVSSPPAASAKPSTTATSASEASSGSHQGAPHIHPHRLRQSQHGPTLPSSSPRSRPPCRAAVAKRTCSSGAFPWPWRSSAAWAMRRQAPGRMRPATGAVAAWSFRTPRRTGAW